MTIREAENKDIESIVSIARESQYISLTENTLKDYMYNSFNKVIISEDDTNKIIGFLIFSFIFPEAEIIDIAVSKNSQRSGCGHLLINYLINYLKTNNGKKIILEVNNDNENACKFYMNFGFNKDGIRKNYYTYPKKADGVLMSLNL